MTHLWLVAAVLAAGTTALGDPARAEAVAGAPAVNVCAVMAPKAGKADALREALLALVEPTIGQDNALAYEVFAADGGVLFLHEAWRSQAELDAHLAKPYVVDFVARIPNLVEGENDAHFGRMISSKTRDAERDPATMVSICSFKRPRPGKERELRDELLALAEPTSREPGHLTYNLYEERDGSLFLFEQWRSRADLEAHFETPYVRRFRALVPELADRNDVFFGRLISARRR